MDGIRKKHNSWWRPRPRDDVQNNKWWGQKPFSFKVGCKTFAPSTQLGKPTVTSASINYATDVLAEIHQLRVNKSTWTWRMSANLAGTLGKFCVWIALRKGKVDAKTEMFLLLATDDAVMSWRRARCKWIPWMPTKTNHTRMLARTAEKEEDGHSRSGVFVVNGQFNPKLTPTVRKNKRERKAWDKIASLEIVFLLSVFFFLMLDLVESKCP